MKQIITRFNDEYLGNTLWSIADHLRWAMDADDLRDTMMSFPFLRVEVDQFHGVTKMILPQN
ncbi:MAG: hypothetical protein ACK475_06605 [Bacteroidota bacterium]|jgi:type I restriction enzyme M protein